MVHKKKQAVESIHDRDRIIVRLPDGMRDRLAKTAETNGRSVTAEVVAAIEKHLEGLDRITAIWQFIEKHRENIEDIGHIMGAVEALEEWLDDTQQHEFEEAPHLMITRRVERENERRRWAQQQATLDEHRDAAEEFK